MIKLFASLWRACLKPSHAWLAASFAAAINLTGMMLELGVGSTFAEIPTWPAITSAVVGGVLLVILFLFRKAPSIRIASALYMINAAAVISTFLLTNPYYATHAERWVPFQGAKLGALIAAMIAPTFIVGLIDIAIGTLGSAIQFATFAPELRQNIAGGEPWATFGFGLAGVLLLAYRFRQIVTSRQMQAAQIEAAATTKLAQSMLGIRDLMNTPLQRLEISARLLRRNSTVNTEPNDSDAITNYIERAVDDLNDLNDRLTAYESQVNWHTGASFDAKGSIDSKTQT